MASQTGVHRRSRQRRWERLRAFWAVVATVAVAFPAVAALAVPAAAEDPQVQYLSVTKTAEPYQLEAGQTFTYSIQATCEEVSCLDAQLTDQLPAELDGFALQGVTTNPGQSDIPRTVSWTENGAELPGEPAVIGAATGLTVDFTDEVVEPAGTGLETGQTFTVQLSLQVPEDIAPGDHEIVNTARTTATNSLPDQAEAPIRISVPIAVDVAASKDWAPGAQDFNPGLGSTISLGVRNTSNIGVDVLTVQEPTDAEDGAAALAATNPFTITDFAGFGASTLPEGAQVRVDAYVLGTDGWTWQEGTAATTPALPAGVTAEDVGGLRFAYSGDIAPSDGADVELDVVQRATHRNTDDDLSTATHSVDNTVVATAESLEHEESAAEDASAGFTVRPAQLDVSASKNIQPNEVTGGESATGTLNATNDGSPVAELRLADLDFFTEEVTFGGFTEAPTWPAGATSARVVYHPLEGDSQVEVPFASGQIPAAPSTPVSGFEVVFSATGNAIETAAYTAVAFTIATTEDVPSQTRTNTVTATAAAANGLSATAEDSDDLTTITPAIGVTLDKQVRPSTPVQPGESAYVSLAAHGTATDRATLHEIVIEDAIGAGETEFWDAFNLVAIAPTQVPASTALTVEVRDADGTWRELTIHGPEAAATIFQLDRTDFAAATGVSTDTITGARFSFDNSAGFANDVVVTPTLVFDARSELRSGAPVTPADEAATPYENSAVVGGEGVSEGGKELTDDDGDVGTGEVITYPGGPGPVGIDKRWDKGFVNAQAGDTATTRLDWRVATGFESVTITDPADSFGAPEGTVFEAFDLRAIAPIGASDTPFSNGWYLKYDTVTDVELYDGEGWDNLDAPAGGWVQNGAFVGYPLNPEQSLTTTGVRISLEENTAAREAAQTAAALDPFAPAPGTGVATSSVSRHFELEWQLRDRTRTSDGTPGEWVTEDVVYNAPDAGDVINSVALEATPIGSGTATRDTDDATIRIFEPEPLVNVVKEVEAQRPIYVPEPGSSLPRPTATWTVTANNASVAAAGHVRVTDPAAACLAESAPADCQLADPNADPFQSDEIDWFAGNPFRYFDLTGIAVTASIEEEVDLDATVVWLLRYDGESFTATGHTGSQAATLAVEDLADVVGVSVTFQAENAGAGGAGTTITQDNRLRITLDSELRVTTRGTDVPLELGVNRTIDVDNRVFAQSYDDVLSPGVATGDLASAQAVLTGGDVNIAPVKTVSPSQVLVTDPDVPVTVTLGANQGTSPRSTLSPSSVVIEDQADSPDFWNSFDFTGLGEVTLPAGADQVQVDVYGPFGDDGALEWVTGAAGSAAVVPVTEDAYGDVQGIRFTFTRSDGQYFDPTVPPAANWSATAQFTVQLRETYRDSGADMVFDGAVANTQTSQSFRTDGKNSEVVASTAPIGLSEGTRELEVEKLTNEGTRIANAGDDVPFRLSFRNAGTGFLTVTELRDTLPAELVHLGEAEPVYTADPGGLLSEDVTLDIEGDGSELVFTWPEGGDRMAPGETFVIDLPFELQPTRDRVHNDIVVTTAEVLDRCGHIDGGTNWSQPGGDTSCATSDFVDTVSGPNLFAVKGVLGSLEGTERGGAYHPGTGATCSPTLQASGGSYYRAPCVAHSATGGVDDWVLRVQNAGTFGIRELTVVDQLPVEGDAFLLSGLGRGSTYRPQLVAESLSTQAPEGTQVVTEITTSPNVCHGSYPDLTGDSPACERAGEEWVPAGPDTDWAAVSGLRIHLDFTDTDAGELDTAEWIDVTFSTRNVVATEADPSGAPATVPAADSFAWNQFGVRYVDVNQQGAETVKRIAPNAVGVHLLTGSLAVAKEVTGPAAATHAPEAFTVELACTIGGEPLDLGEHAGITLSAADDYRARVDGIPYGIDPLTACTVTEVGETGEFGETSRSIDPAGGTLVLTESTDPTRPVEEQAVPAAQVATVTNDYQFSSLSVTKLVDTEAVAGEFGPFDFELTCTSAIGTPVVLGEDGATTLAFTLEDGATFAVAQNRIPVGADCTVTETDGFFADEIVIVGDNVTDHGDGSATVVPGVSPAEVTVTNGYDAATLTVAKSADGAGADLFGDGPFGFHALCTYQGQELLDEHFDLLGGETRSFGVFPAGTECAVTETATGGATDTVLVPTDGTVQLVVPDDEASVGNVTVEATNTFDLGMLDVVKEIDGAGAELFGAGPFEAQAVCTWEKDGETLPIQLPADGALTLSQENGYRATVETLLVGADCVVTETATGGATSSAIAPEDGAVTIPATEAGEQQSVTVTLTNTFDVTSLRVTKEVQGNLDAPGAAGPFEIELVCEREVDAETVSVEIPGGPVRELSDDVGFSTAFEQLPVGAACQLTETETSDADGTLITVALEGAAPEATESTSADVDLGLTTAPGQAHAVIVNAYDADPVPPVIDDASSDASSDGGSGAGGSGLAQTGVAVAAIAGVAALLTMLGLGMLAVRRRTARR